MFGLGQSAVKGVIIISLNQLSEVSFILFSDLNILMCMNISWSLGLLQIVASYTTTSGETKTSLLLTSGW